jgi:hypothetical protein
VSMAQTVLRLAQKEEKRREGRSFAQGAMFGRALQNAVRGCSWVLQNRRETEDDDGTKLADDRCPCGRQSGERSRRRWVSKLPAYVKVKF